MIRILLSVLLLLLLLPNYSGEARLALFGPTPVVVKTQRVELDWREPSRRQLGKLHFLGGIRFESASRAFGGFSGMLVDGENFTLLSDGGNIVRFQLDRSWQVRNLQLGELPDGPGRGWSKRDRDSESLTRDPETGQLWVGFEEVNEVWRYSPGFAQGEAYSAPLAMAGWPSGSGPESMVRLRDGSFIVLSEGGKGRGAGTRPALWFTDDPVKWPHRGFEFSYRPPIGYRPTDIAELPDGRLLVLNRAISFREGFTVIVTIIDRRAVGAGRIVAGRPIARFAAPVVHDNFEAMAVVREGSSTILWIVSDNNDWRLQRSLLLKFRLDE